VTPRRDDTWEAHPTLAWWVRVAVLLVPLLVSLVAAVVLVLVLPHPTTLLADLGWWTAVLGGAFLAAQLVERLARRALPLAALLTLSLVFPDRAPSRLRTARRTSLRELERQVARLEETGEPSQAARSLVALVGALGLHDKRTRGHSERVRAYVDLITEEMGLPEHDRLRIRWAALIHDIGKLTVPGAVLNGGSDLHEDDWHALRQHPTEGERLAAGLLPWLGEWGQCVPEHHERWDGHGYPLGLAGTEISRGARIVAVADAYEVMTANRSYQKAISPAAARAELSRCAGTDFDPAVVRAFLQVSIGRLRGVLGPFAFLPALPFAAAGDRAGDVVKGMTATAAAVAVGLALATPPSAPSPSRTPYQQEAPAVAAPTVRATPAPTPVVTTPPPAPVRRPVLLAVSAPLPVASPAPVVTTSPAAVQTPAPVPAPLLYLAAGGGLVTRLPGAGTVSVQAGGSAAVFASSTRTGWVLRGAPLARLVVDLQTWHGRGNPRSSVTLALQDCGRTCRTLGTGTAYVPQRQGVQTVAVRMASVDAVVAAGHALRVLVSVQGTTGVRDLLVLYGGSAPSTLRLA
jgi:hypothetical protein